VAKDFKKLSCYAKKVIINKVGDELLKIHVTDEFGDEHNFKIGVEINNFQNIDTFGNKEGHMVDIPALDIKYSVNKTDKLNSKNISMNWNHAEKPSVFEIKNKDEVVFSGSYADAMKWERKNISECSQQIVKKQSLR
tara:strand:- start:1545 stop:1955 length:411 start_codon:yes stop_codon:yes gene_type:complete